MYIRRTIGLRQKLLYLGSCSRYDVTGVPGIVEDGLEKRCSSFLYYSVGHGKIIPLFKVLLDNRCINNCYYCAIRKERNVIRMNFSPEELAGIFMEYYRRGIVKGFFLSSGIYPSPDRAQEKILEVIRILRERYGYPGYIHSKLLPDASVEFIPLLGRYSDRLSINLEVPSERYVEKVSPDKSYSSDLFAKLLKIAEYNRAHRLRAGVTTQLVVGSAGETDKEILKFTYYLYKRQGLCRVYYSAFRPVQDTPLETRPPCSPMRELRLYQADILVRRYGYTPEELSYRDGNLILDTDPKIVWAKNHPEFFPVEITDAGFRELLRVPGIGLRTAKTILENRHMCVINSVTDLLKMGIRRRALPFITVKGKYFVRKGYIQSALW